VPDAILTRIGRGPRDQQAAEGEALALETIEALRDIRGVSGVHLISIHAQDAILRVIERAGIGIRDSGRNANGRAASP
jgi:methylenetetrahydrofolate reductase (NADPH)